MPAQPRLVFLQLHISKHFKQAYACLRVLADKHSKELNFFSLSRSFFLFLRLENDKQVENKLTLLQPLPLRGNSMKQASNDSIKKFLRKIMLCRLLNILMGYAKIYKPIRALQIRNSINCFYRLGFRIFQFQHHEFTNCYKLENCSWTLLTKLSQRIQFATTAYKPSQGLPVIVGESTSSNRHSSMAISDKLDTYMIPREGVYSPKLKRRNLMDD